MVLWVLSSTDRFGISGAWFWHWKSNIETLSNLDSSVGSFYSFRSGNCFSFCSVPGSESTKELRHGSGSRGAFCFVDQPGTWKWQHNMMTTTKDVCPDRTPFVHFTNAIRCSCRDQVLCCRVWQKLTEPGASSQASGEPLDTQRGMFC